MDNAVYGKAMAKLKSKIDRRLLSNEKGYLKWTAKPKYMSEKIFDNNLKAICKDKVPLTLRKPTYVRMCVLNFSKVLMYDFIMIKLKINMVTTQDYYSQALDSLMYEIKTEDVYEDFSTDMFGFSNYSAGSKYYNKLKKSVGKMKDETADIAIKEFIGLILKIYLLLVDDSSEYKKASGVNKNVVAILSQSEYKQLQFLLIKLAYL